MFQDILGKYGDKCTKILNTLFHTFLPVFLYIFIWSFPKIRNRMANSVDLIRLLLNGAV